MTSLMVSFLAFVSGAQDRLTTQLKSEKGATAVEYGLLVALIAAVIIAVVATLGTKILAAFQTIVTNL